MPTEHACDIAQSLGISKIIIHKYSSILSAYGIALADLVEERQEPASKMYDDSTAILFEERLEALSNEARQALEAQGVSGGDVEIEKFLNMRYQGSDSQLMVPASEED